MSLQMQPLLQLAGWGTAAAVGLVLVVMAAHSSSGQQRLAGKVPNEKAIAEAAAAAQRKRIAETEKQTRQLVEIVRDLNSDRALLIERITVLERNLEDVTGSIKRQEATTPLPARPTPPAAVPPSAADAETKSTPKAPPDIQVATATAPTEIELEIRTGPAIGIDIGSASNFDGLRKLWNSANSDHPELFDGLYAVASVRENSKTRAAELRLVVGPLPNTRAAARICEALAATRHYCRQAPFEGRQFSHVAPETTRRSKTAADRKRPRANP